MAASYPAGFDTMSDPGANLSGPPLHSTMHNQINDVLEAIEAELGLTPSGSFSTVAGLIVPTAWTGVTLTGTWANLDAPHTVQYRRTGDVVELRGAIFGGTVPSAAFTLPAGFRPNREETFAVPSNPIGLLSVATTGVVTPGAPGTTGFFYLSGVRFSTSA